MRESAYARHIHKERSTRSRLQTTHFLTLSLSPPRDVSTRLSLSGYACFCSLFSRVPFVTYAMFLAQMKMNEREELKVDYDVYVRRVKALKAKANANAKDLSKNEVKLDAATQKLNDSSTEVYQLMMRQVSD